jgi:hypothetical protein
MLRIKHAAPMWLRIAGALAIAAALVIVFLYFSYSIDVISKQKAISIAEQEVPPAVVARAQLIAQEFWSLKPPIWHISFECPTGAYATQAELGWQQDSITTFDGYGPYCTVYINIDLRSGKVFARVATPAAQLVVPTP